MRKIGYLLITGAFLYGAYLLVLDERLVSWPPYLLAFAVGAVGVALVRRALHLEAHHEDRQSASIETLRSSLSRVVEEIERLETEKDTINVYDLRIRIDERLRADLDTFADAREVLSHLYGLQAYADVMNPFAAGERYLNRVWSASTDGYIDEAHAYITHARDQLVDARARLNALL